MKANRKQNGENGVKLTELTDITVLTAKSKPIQVNMYSDH